LDEPTAGLDPLITKKVREHIFNQGGERKKTVLVSTHNLDEAVRVCDEIAVIHHGTILEQGTWETFRQKHLESGLVTITLNPLQGHYAEIVANLPGVSHVTVDMATGMFTYHTWDAHITNPKVIASLVSAGAAIVSVTQKETRLEEAYLKLVGEDTAQNGHRRQGSAEK
jgi:ABC-type multidrug transport system ATPase subunit